MRRKPATITIANTLEDISRAVVEVEERLRAYKLSATDLAHSLLTLEETLVKMGEAAGKTDRISIRVRKGLKKVKIKLSCRGREIRIDDGLIDSADIDTDNGPEAESIIRDMVLRANSDRLRYRNVKGVNVVDIIASTNKMAMLYETIGAMLLGVIIGLLVRNLFSHDVTLLISDGLFHTLYSVFLTLIQMVVAPLVFFSIAASISGFSDLSALGRTGMKVMTAYFFTTAIAVSIAMTLSYIAMPEQMDLSGMLNTSSQSVQAIEPSLLDSLLSIVPHNFLGAFVESQMLQIIVLAMLVGIVSGKIGKHSHLIRTAIEAFNDLFGGITGIISRLLPIAVFGSSARMAATFNAEGVGVVVSWAGTTLLCILIMFIVYLIMLTVMGRLNPFTFARKYMQAPLTGLMTSSSSATMPVTLECCRRLGVSSRIYSFSIPLGATINMDGTSIFFITASMFLAGLFGISIEGATLTTFVFTVILFSMASPGVPGAGTACIITLLSIVGVPPEALGLLIGISPLVELPLTATNVMGDGVVTTIVAKSEDALDMKVFNS